MSKYFTENIKNKDPAWEFMIKHKITPNQFQRALSKYRHVELHAIETGLRRYRLRTTGAAASIDAKQPRGPKKKSSPCAAKRRHPHHHSSKKLTELDGK